MECSGRVKRRGAVESRARPILFALVVAVAIVPGWQSGFTVRPTACEAVPSADQLAAAVLNLRHVVTYAVLGALATAAWPRRRWLALGTVLVFSGLMELQQALFGAGHCRLWDLLPNALGLALAGVVVRLWLPAPPRDAVPPHL